MGSLWSSPRFLSTALSGVLRTSQPRERLSGPCVCLYEGGVSGRSGDRSTGIVWLGMIVPWERANSPSGNEAVLN